MTNPAGNQSYNPVIFCITDMSFHRICHSAYPKGINHFRDINIDVGDVDTQPGIKVFIAKLMRNSITQQVIRIAEGNNRRFREQSRAVF